MSDLDQRIASLSPEKRELLLRRLNEQKSAANRAPAAMIPRRSQTSEPLPLSFTQESLWLVDQMTPGSSAYNVSCAFRLNGPLNVNAFSQSLQNLVDRHESLRTTFSAAKGRPVQVIAPALQAPFSIIDMQHLPETEREQHARQCIDEHVARPFNLAQGPLMRTILFRLAEDEHFFLLILHHIICDGWSVEVLLRELATCYNALSGGQPASLPDLPIQYGDYALWQRERLQGEEWDRLLTYWKQQLAGAPSVLDLPADHPRPALQSFQGANLSFQLPVSLAEGLRALSQQEHCSHFMTLLAAFQTLLFRYTGRDDIVVGSTIANRNRAETEGLVGYLVNMLVLRTDLSGSPSFRELLRRVRTVALGAYNHQEFPFEKLVEALQPERSLSYTPLFQVSFALENTSRSAMEIAGMTWQQLDLATKTSKFDLDLTMHEEPDGFTGSIEFNTDLFEASTIQRMIGHWHTLLTGLIANPDLPIDVLPLMTQDEQHQILVEWNATQAPFPQEYCAQHLFEQQVERTPDAVAVVYGNAQLTYRELNARANQLAHFLQTLGVGPDTLVGLCVDRSLEMVVGVLGILKAGGTYVPLTPNYPAERLAFMLEDTQVPILLTQQHLLSRLPKHHARVICLDTSWDTIALESQTNPASETKPEQLAYVIYTSGSTGKPKGVMLTHAGLVNAYYAWEQAYQLRTRCSRHLQMANFSFDVFTGDLIRALASGGRLVLCPPDLLLDAEGLYALMRREQVDAAEFVPAVLRNLMGYLKKTHQSLDFMRLLVVGSDSWSGNEYQEFQRLCGPQTRLINSYGATEATIDSTYFEAGDTPLLGEAAVPIGRPFANMQMYVLDAHLQPVPIGVPGELYIGGRGLARGYLNRPDLTAERFIRHPLSTEPGARLYKTGDLARYLPTGQIEFLGRIDQQVKIRGFRIELGEIETALLQHPAVREVVLLAREDQPGNKRLVAYVVPQPEKRITFQDARDFLKQSLPEYMLPTALVVLEALPLTPNGKLDRKALPAPEASERPEGEGFVAPTLIEHYQLLEIWEELLDTRPIGIKDNFFFLGGHSLLAIRLVSRIEEVFGKKISLATLFMGPTIEELTQALQQQEKTLSRAPIFPVQEGGSRRPFFFLHGAWTGGGFYCYRLARDLGPDQPFYALQPYRLDGLGVPPTFEAMATAHLEAIRAIQPEGPYLLGGFCNGGMVAAEMARQLQEQGQKVELMVMVDPSIPARIDQRLARSSMRGLGRLLGKAEDKQLDIYLRFRGWFAYAREIYRYARFDAYRKTAVRIRGKRGLFGLALPELSVLATPTKKLREDWAAVYLWTLPGRIAEFESNKLVFFWSSRGKPDKLWSKLAAAREAEVYTIPGWHSNWTAEKIRAMAEHLRVCLDKLESADIRKEELVAS